MSNKYTLSLSSNYVSHWGSWEGIREILQNAYDQADRDSNCELEVSFKNGKIRISTSTGELEKNSLLLGQSTKGSQDRGSFGEGYKLSMLVLSRVGHKVTVFNNDFKWTPVLEHCDKFNCKVLNIYEEVLKPREEGVCFIVDGVSQELWEEVQRNTTSKSGILFDKDEVGRVYVGGLFVCHMENYKYGYSLNPSDVKLDRDRGTVDSFDLSYFTSHLWSNVSDSATLNRLIEEDAEDVRHLIHRTSSESLAAKEIVKSFDEKYGTDTIPVTTQEELSRAQSSGTKFALVPKTVRDMIARVRNIFIPNSGGPLERLENLSDRYKYHMPDDMKKELNDIILTLKSQQSIIEDICDDEQA